MSQLDNITLSNAKDLFLSCCKSENKSPKTVEAYGYNLDLFIQHIGDIPLSTVTSFHIRSYKEARSQHVKPATQHQAHRVLRTFFNWLVEDKILKETPMSKNIKAPKLTRKIMDTYSKGDLRKFMDACQGKHFLPLRNKAMVAVLLDTGVRENELVQIRVKDCNFRTGAIRVYFGKGDVERVVRVGEASQLHLSKYLLIREMHLAHLKRSDPEQLFISEEGKRMTAEGLGCTIRKLGERAGVNRPGVHKFRHTMAIEFLRNGGSIAVLQHILGHTNVTTTMKYLTALNSDDVMNSHQKFSPGDSFLR